MTLDILLYWTGAVFWITTILQRGGRISNSKNNTAILMRNVLIVVEQGLKMTMKAQKESLNS